MIWFAPIGDSIILIREVTSMLDQFPDFGGTIIIDQDKSNAVFRDMEIGYNNLVHKLPGRKDAG